METSRDKIATTEEGTTSIQLHYSRQFQTNGHTHTVNAEAMLAVGANSEKREQVIRELELSVEQLVQQITQRGSRSARGTQAQTPVRSGAPGQATEPSSTSALPRPASYSAQPTAPLPVSESMPTTPTASGERTINLPYFIEYIKKRWNMSGQEAMELLDVHELTGLNLREALFKLRDIKEPPGTTNSNPAQTRTRAAAQPPLDETPRQATRSTSPAGTRAATRSEAQPVPRPVHDAPVAPPASAPEHESRPGFAGSPKAPIPIHMGVVLDRTSVPSYSFEEEDEEEEYNLPEASAEDSHRQAAVSKLEELKSKRGGNAASPERLTVLNNVLDGQISEEQLEQLIAKVWNATNKKRLKVPQVEALISWAKEDYFVNELESLLKLASEEEE